MGKHKFKLIRKLLEKEIAKYQKMTGGKKFLSWMERVKKAKKKRAKKQGGQGVKQKGKGIRRKKGRKQRGYGVKRKQSGQGKKKKHTKAREEQIMLRTGLLPSNPLGRYKNRLS